MTGRLGSILLTVVSLLVVTPGSVLATIKTQSVDYVVGNAKYIGFLAYDDSTADKRPGILIAPEWIGLNDYSRDRAKQLAGMGCVAFVFDPYGEGKNAADVRQAAEWSSTLKADRPQLRARINAAFDTLKKQDRVDPMKTAAIGYCFGGTTVLELARSGADVLGVISFHGGLSTPLPAKAGELKARILVCHGADDPFVKPEEVAGFEKEMREAKADWQLVSYGNAVHSFTNPAAKGQLEGAKYNEKADKRSWKAMKSFLNEIFDGSVGVRTSMFGDLEDVKSVIFVCDASGSMIGRLANPKNELTKAIEFLNGRQAFDLIFVAGEKVTSLDVDTMLIASPYTKRQAYRFMEDVVCEGEMSPLPALESAIKLKPDLICFFVWGELKHVPSAVEIEQLLARLPANHHTTINTILCDNRDNESERALRTIASGTNGRYRYLTEQDLQN